MYRLHGGKIHRGRRDGWLLGLLGLLGLFGLLGSGARQAL